MLEIALNNITKNFGFKNILKGASFEVMSGERIALVGRNGSGKSTILKLIADEERPNEGAVSIRRGATVGMLEQIPALLNTDVTVRQVLMEPFSDLFAVERRLRELEGQMSRSDADIDRLMRSYAHQQGVFETMGGYEVEERLGRITTGFGLTELLDRPFNVLSGGQKTIVTLAKTLLGEPDILLLDEPTNHLDVRTLEWFEGFLAKYRGTALIVSHDRYFLDKVATKTVMLEGGACRTFQGNYSWSVKERERQLMIEFEQYKNQQKKIDAMKAQIRRYRDWARQSDNEDLYRKAKELEKRLERIEMLDRPEVDKKQLPIHFSGGRTGRDALKCSGVILSAGELPLLRGVDFTLLFRERACLLGDNGTGKTTLLRAAMGLHALDAGEIKLAPSAKIGYIPQEIRFRDDKMALLDAFRDEYVCTEGQGRSILAKYGFLGESVFKRVSALSGGEKVLLKLAILVQREINFLILDEPTNHIDIDTREILEESLLDFNATILFVSHDRYFIRKLANRILSIQDGEVRSFSGDYDTFRAKS